MRVILLHCSFQICSVCLGKSITVAFHAHLLHGILPTAPSQYAVSVFSSHSHPATCWSHPILSQSCSMWAPKSSCEYEQGGILHHSVKNIVGETKQWNDQPRSPPSRHRDYIACKPHRNVWQLRVWTHMCLVTINHKWGNRGKEGKETPQLLCWGWFFFFWFSSETAGFSGNCVIKFGCLFEFVTLTGWVTGAESRSKCRWFADDDFFFQNPVATGTSPVGWLKAATGLFLSSSLPFLFLLSLSISLLLSLFLPPSPHPGLPLQLLWKGLIRLIGGKENIDLDLLPSKPGLRPE